MLMDLGFSKVSYIEKADGRKADEDRNIPALNRRKTKVNLAILGPNCSTTPLEKITTYFKSFRNWYYCHTKTYL